MTRQEKSRIPPGELRGLRKAVCTSSPAAAVLGTPEERTVKRIAAASIEESLGYLRRWRPEFEVMSVRYIGLITWLSGTPLD